MSKNRNKMALWITLALLTGASIGGAVYDLSLQAAEGFTIEEQIGDTSTESSIDGLFDITNNKTHITSYNNDGTKTWYFDDGFWVKFDSEYNVIAHGLTSKEAASIINNPVIGPMGYNMEKDFNGHIKEWSEEPGKEITEDGNIVYSFPEGPKIILYVSSIGPYGGESRFHYEGDVNPAQLPDPSENLFGITKNKTHTTSYNNDGTKTWYFDDGFWVKFDFEYNVIAHGLVSQKAASTITSETGLDIEKEFEGQIKEWPEEPKKTILGDGDVVYDFPEGIEIVFNNDAELVNGEPDFIYVGNDGQSLSSDDAESTIGL